MDKALPDNGPPDNGPPDNGAAIGWDLGGAHLKAARARKGGRIEAVMQLPCPLWQGLDHLERALREAMAQLGPAPRHAVTMSGEMADLFPSRAEGVRRLIAATTAALPGAEILIFAGPAGLLCPELACARPESVASANWLASAAFAARRLDHGLFVDVGSTTTDIVALRQGAVLAAGSTDCDRLTTGELIYTGIVRTPVMAVAMSVPFAGARQGLMAELFATMADVHRLNGTLPEGADQMPAADGGAKTARESARRLARMLGRDLGDADMTAWKRLAAHLAGRQLAQIEAGCTRAASRAGLGEEAPLIGAGCGRFLVADLAERLGRPYRDFGELLDVDPSVAGPAAACAPAAALAALAATP